MKLNALAVFFMIMDYFYFLCCTLLFFFFFISIFLITTTKYQKLRSRSLPPSPPAIPILGHIHLLKHPLHRSLKSISDNYGPIVYLRSGVRRILVVSSPEIAEECLTKNDIIFANRPNSAATKSLSYNNTTIGFAPYGDYWRNLRRVTSTNIFSPLSLQNSSSIRVEEIRLTVKKLLKSAESDSEKWTELDLSCLLKELVHNTIMRMTCGKNWSKSADVFQQVIPLTNNVDSFPILKWIGFVGGTLKKLKKLQSERDRVLQDIVDDCRRRNNGGGGVDKRKRTVVEALLGVQEAEPEYYTDDIIKGLASVMFTAGADTTNVTMQWAMSLLLDHPEVLAKAKKELENKIPQGHLIEDDDLPKLPYLSSIINETLRLFPAVPLLLPHFSSEDCNVSGYTVPKNTTLFVNVWAIHMDPNIWEEPTKFKPERFEGIELGNDKGFKFLPFGKGRRACPGNTLAMRYLGLVLGTLIQCFDWKRLGDETHVDLEEKGGVLTIQKAKPLKALYKPRFSAANGISID